ncbi:VOC family protein [Sulfidibacter corallicola]|uniref:VOC family protein n=1 Tax=Sulfidibacter corallicola TaxID=2818388 RepID=A0A8A4TSX2_SULCO|nr:VOC family protein [Sulfidibacter corallicola]QTD52640.1 VOC family protein [Sulfidibacter corallicola]
MSEHEAPKVGSIGWIDLTVDNADEVRDFYKEVVGYKTSEVSMGDYADYCLNVPETNTPVAGVCHARGENANLPAQWLIYMTVADLDASLAAVEARGGKIVVPAKGLAGGRFAVITDPAGAISALYQPPSS